jgi:hypothetical protein
MLVMTEQQKERVVDRLKELLPAAYWGGSIKDHRFHWCKNGNLQVSAVAVVYPNMRNIKFTLHFSPHHSLVAFKLFFNGKESQKLAREYNLRDEFDDLLWNMLPSDKSLFGLAIENVEAIL